MVREFLMTDDQFYAPNHRPPPPRTQPRPGEFLFEFVRESDHAHFQCELKYHGEWGCEAQFFKQGERLIALRFDTRALALGRGRAQGHSERQRMTCRVVPTTGISGCVLLL
jgi:hypothetical protein